ncbi:MAG: hypothetical protein AB7S26_26690 [Sandaracinaceae bacterium]
MPTFFVEGGYAMWMTLILFLGAGALAFVRRADFGERIALSGAVLTVASGLAGLSTGLYTTVAYVSTLAAAEQAHVLGVGIRESVHNTLFAGILAALLVLLGLGIGLTRRTTAAT